MVSFDAELEVENLTPSVVLTWTTSLEVNTDGFFLYRQDSNGNTLFIPLTGLFPSVGAQGGLYQYRDNTVVLDNTYSYLLVERKKDGTLKEYTDLIQVIVIGTAPNFFGNWLPMITN